MVVVIVVPALAQGQQRQPDSVAAGVRGIVATAAEHVVKRIEDEGAVQKYNR